MLRDRPLRLHFDEVRRVMAETPDSRWSVGTLQVVLYVAVGGGRIGKLFAENPEEAYIDSRVGRRPYSRKEIENIRQCLVELAIARGLNPRALPPMPDFHNCGVW